VHLRACLEIILPVLFVCRDIFYRHGGHVIRDLLRLYCRYFVFQHVNDWDENLDVLGLPTLLFHVLPYDFLSRSQDAHSLSLSLARFCLSALFQRTTLASDHFLQNIRALSPFLFPRGLLSSGLFGSNFMPCRYHRLAALITRPCSTLLYHLLTIILTVKPHPLDFFFLVST
jgi:hypothetical protein